MHRKSSHEEQPEPELAEGTDRSTGGDAEPDDDELTDRIAADGSDRFAKLLRRLGG